MEREMHECMRPRKECRPVMPRARLAWSRNPTIQPLNKVWARPKRHLGKRERGEMSDEAKLVLPLVTFFYFSQNMEDL